MSLLFSSRSFDRRKKFGKQWGGVVPLMTAEEKRAQDALFNQNVPESVRQDRARIAREEAEREKINEEKKNNKPSTSTVEKINTFVTKPSAEKTAVTRIAGEILLPELILPLTVADTTSDIVHGQDINVKELSIDVGESALSKIPGAKPFLKAGLATREGLEIADIAGVKAVRHKLFGVVPSTADLFLLDKKEKDDDNNDTENNTENDMTDAERQKAIDKSDIETFIATRKDDVVLKPEQINILKDYYQEYGFTQIPPNIKSQLFPTETPEITEPENIDYSQSIESQNRTMDEFDKRRSVSVFDKFEIGSTVQPQVRENFNTIQPESQPEPQPETEPQPEPQPEGLPEMTEPVRVSQPEGLSEMPNTVRVPQSQPQEPQPQPQPQPQQQESIQISQPQQFQPQSQPTSSRVAPQVSSSNATTPKYSLSFAESIYRQSINPQPVVNKYEIINGVKKLVSMDCSMITNPDERKRCEFNKKKILGNKSANLKF